MAEIVDGWFYEKSDTFPGQAFGLEVEEVLFSGKSKYQDVLVFRRYGLLCNVLGQLPIDLFLCT